MITSTNASKTNNPHPDTLATTIASAYVCEPLTEVGVGTAEFVV